MHHQHNQFLNNLNYLNFNNNNSENVPLIERSVSAKPKHIDYFGPNNIKNNEPFNCPSINSFHLGSVKSDRGSLTDTYRLNILNTKKESRSLIERTSNFNGNLIPFKFNNISYQSLRPQSMTTAKHFMEYSFKNQNMLQLNPNTNKNTDTLKITNANSSNNINNSNNNINNLSNLPQSSKNRRDNDNFSNSNYGPNNPHHTFVNPKIINDSNKFIENILAHSKRNLKPPPSLRVNNSDSRNQLQLLSASLNLPANVITINRSSEERFLFPDKLILERRNLNICPNIEGDLQLKLINYQHNQIRTIQNLDQMSNLIFLDLYDNRIERINGISNLINLRVLMLGKNRISKIENLENLVHLDVLDLHGNQIPCIENLNSLHELRVLNIAANSLKKVENLEGLYSLVELNLRRNQIAEINDLEHCTKLQRLFLSFNEIVSILRIKNLNQIINLQELTLDNNPLSAEKNYKRNILAQLVALKKLDSKKVTDEEKRNAERMYCKSESKKKELENYYSLEEKRKIAIRDAKSDWHNQQQQSNNKFTDLNKLERSTLNSSLEILEHLREGTSDNLLINNSHSTMEVNNTTGPLCSNLIQRSIHMKAGNPSNGGTFNYQNYLQQYQHQLIDPNSVNSNSNNSNGANSKKINAKLKIVQMRNKNESLGNNNLNHQISSFSNQNVNLVNSPNNSSNNSLHDLTQNLTTSTSNNNDNSLNLNESQGQGIDNDYTEPFFPHKQPTNSMLPSRSSSAKIGNFGTNIRNPNNLLSSIATTSSTSVNNGQGLNNSNNNKRSTTFNNGSNVHEENTMFFYGSKSMEILDNKLDQTIVSQVTIISFNYIDFDDNLCKNFTRIKNKFPNAVNLIFTCCNIKSLNQIDSIADWKKLESLTINKEDNPIYMITMWSHYAIFRLINLQLKKLNDKVITQEDIAISNRYLNHYMNLALYLPEFKLISILGQDKKKLIKMAKENLNDSSIDPTNEQMTAREQLTKLVLNSNFQNSRFNNSSNVVNLDTDFFLADKKMNQSQTLLNGVVSQMHYNDMKSQKIRAKQPQIWKKIVEGNVKNSNKLDKHIFSICKKHNIKI